MKPVLRAMVRDASSLLLFREPAPEAVVRVADAAGNVLFERALEGGESELVLRLPTAQLAHLVVVSADGSSELRFPHEVVGEGWHGGAAPAGRWESVGVDLVSSEVFGTKSEANPVAGLVANSGAAV
jgi:hypothetical protein